jgi:hypothetical protein
MGGPDFGYSYHKKYSRRELVHFYQDYDKMTVIYTSSIEHQNITLFSEYTFCILMLTC